MTQVMDCVDLEYAIEKIVFVHEKLQTKQMISKYEIGLARRKNSLELLLSQ